jgi:hypothetical protein
MSSCGGGGRGRGGGGGGAGGGNDNDDDDAKRCTKTAAAQPSPTKHHGKEVPQAAPQRQTGTSTAHWLESVHASSHTNIRWLRKCAWK